MFKKACNLHIEFAICKRNLSMMIKIPCENLK